MTNEEAKKLLQATRLMMLGKDNQPISDLYYALEKGIEALEEEPKTGHWIRITNGAMKEKYICSECGRQIEDDGIEVLLPVKYPYCHCGCRMVEPQERSE